ncbi:MAG: cytochrome-c oxidase, cbb3-type subunit III [Pseudomonadota bacterium]
MADLPSGFFSGWIIVLTTGGLIVLVALVISVYFNRDDDADVQAHVWDETLTEGTAPAPMWWFWLIFALLIFSVIYLLLYPGLGSFQGALKWSQGRRLQEATALYQLEFREQHETFLSSGSEQLNDDKNAMRSAASLYKVHCAACHGQDGGGQAKRFPALNDDTWQWGSSLEQIKQSIALGRMAVMPSWYEVLGDDGVAATSAYVMALQKSDGHDQHALGKANYEQICAACHGLDGRGNEALGAPNLTDDVWLYGASENAIYASIAKGRAGIMPAHGGRLKPFEINLLATWIADGMQ